MFSVVSKINGYRRPVYIVFVAIALICCVYTIIRNNGDWGLYIDNFYQSYTNMTQGKIPYSDFPFEYPPLTLLYAIIPGVLSFSYESYGIMYIIVSTLFFILTVYLMEKMVSRYGPYDSTAIILATATLIVLCAEILLKNDVITVFLMIAAIYCYLEKRHYLAFILLALAVMTKMFPLVVGIAFIIPFIMNREYGKAVRCVAVSALVCLIVSLPFIIIDAGTAFSYLTYHTDRGLQVESFASGLVLLINLFTPVCTTVFDYGSSNITGALPNAIASVLTPLMIASLIAFLAICVYYKDRIRQRCDNSFVLLSCVICIFIFLIFSKVFSTQFIMWIILPLAVYLALNTNGRYYGRLMVMSIISMILTASIYGFAYPDDLQPATTLLLVARNVILLVMMFYLCKIFWEDHCHPDVTA